MVSEIYRKKVLELEKLYSEKIRIEKKIYKLDKEIDKLVGRK